MIDVSVRFIAQIGQAAATQIEYKFNQGASSGRIVEDYRYVLLEVLSE